MADGGGGDDAAGDEVVLHGADAHAGLQLKAEQRQDAGEELPGVPGVAFFKGVPDGDEVGDAIAAGHGAAGAALVFFDEELRVEAAIDGESVAGGLDGLGDFGGGGRRFDFGGLDEFDFFGQAGEQRGRHGDLG